MSDLTRDQVEAWLAGYKAAWEGLDPDKAASLFTDDATYQDTPFNEPYQGPAGVRAYWAGVTADQKDVVFTANILAVSGNTGLVHWHSAFTQPSSGATVVLDGMFALDFAGDLVRRLREWWHIEVTPAK